MSARVVVFTSPDYPGAVLIRIEGGEETAEVSAEWAKRFESAFPHAPWESTYKAWLIPQDQLNALGNFCTDMFGPKGFQMPPEYIQERLF